MHSHNFYGSGINNIYLDIYDLLLHHPDYVVNPRGESTNELMNVTIELSNPLNNITDNEYRKMSMRYAIGELCFYLDGRNDVDSIAHYGPFWKHLSDDGRTVNSAYGKRIFYEEVQRKLLSTIEKPESQYAYAAGQLVADKNTRKSVIVVYNKNDSKKSLDNPCTMFLQFYIRNNKLFMHTHMRSNDIYLGLPYDVFFFSTLHQMMHALLEPFHPNLKLGSYMHSVTSMHLYTRDIGKEQKDIKCLTPPRITFNDANLLMHNLRDAEAFFRKGGLNYKASSRKFSAFESWAVNILTEVNNER